MDIVEIMVATTVDIMVDSTMDLTQDLIMGITVVTRLEILTTMDIPMEMETALTMAQEGIAQRQVLLKE